MWDEIVVMYEVIGYSDLTVEVRTLSWLGKKLLSNNIEM